MKLPLFRIIAFRWLGDRKALARSHLPHLGADLRPEIFSILTNYQLF
ncbi:MAG: hypothetical protein ACL9RN_00600 [Cylindrospermopsis raciborskii]